MLNNSVIETIIDINNKKYKCYYIYKFYKINYTHNLENVLLNSSNKFIMIKNGTSFARDPIYNFRY